MIKTTITKETDLQDFLNDMASALARDDDTIEAEILIPKGCRLTQPGAYGGEGWTNEGIRVANILDQRILPVRRRTRYLWKRRSCAGPAGIVWSFSLRRKAK